LAKWTVTGGESGPRARPAHPDWFRSLRDQCVAAGVPFFFKQWGQWAPREQFASFEEWNKAGKHAMVMRQGQASVVPGRDNPDPEFGLTCSDLDGNDGAAAMGFIARHEAGRMLDGREHNEFPTGQAIRNRDQK